MAGSTPVDMWIVRDGFVSASVDKWCAANPESPVFHGRITGISQLALGREMKRPAPAVTGNGAGPEHLSRRCGMYPSVTLMAPKTATVGGVA